MTGFEHTTDRAEGQSRSKKEIFLQQLDQALEEAKQEAERIAADVESSPEQRRYAEKNVRIGEKRRELFLAEHDVTGSLKGDRFGQDLAVLFNAENAFVTDQEGNLTVSAEMEKTHVLLVNMGELDRLNSAGDHGPGDAALAMTFQKIESVVKAQLMQAHPEMKDEAELASRYSIYRYSGNDFAIILKDANLEMTDTLRGELVSLDLGKPNGDRVPLSTDSVPISEVYQVLNRLREQPDEREQFDGEAKKATLAIDVLKDLVQTQNDISKGQIRMERMVEKIHEARKAGDESKAEEFYLEFQQKSLKALFEDPKIPSESLPYAQLVSELEGLRAFDIPPSATWRHALESRPMEAALRQLKSRREEDFSTDQAVGQVALERLRTRITPARKEGGEQAAVYAPPKPTRGKMALEGLQKIAETALEQNQKNPEDMDAYQDAEIARLDYAIASAWHDHLTGLERRGPMYASMEKAFEEKKTVSTLFIDMAFLKYFNNVGGSKVGDVAIQKAAEILDAVAAKFADKGVTAYRFGGDEFAMSIVGGDEELLKQVRLEINTLQAEAGPIPASPESQPGYVPEALVFNIGATHAGDKDTFKERLKSLHVKLHKEGTPEEANELAELAIKFSDKEVELYKAIDRLDLLVTRFAKEGETAHGKLIEEYSQKAIFGKLGSEKVREWAKAIAEAGEEQSVAVLQRVQKEIREFTLERIDKKNEKKTGYKNSIDRLMDNQIRFSYFVKRERELEATIEHLSKRLADLSARLAEKDTKIEELHAALRIAQEERETVAGLKQKIIAA